MKNIGWVCFLFCVMMILFLITQIISVKYDLEEKNYRILCLEKQNEELLQKQKNLDWFESHINEIDEYIKWKDTLIIIGAENIKPVERTLEEQYEERLEVIQNAIAYSKK